MESQVHKLRDGWAVAQLLPVFLNRGIEYGGVILNYDPEIRHAMGEEKKLLASQCELSETDLLFLPTRPPLHDAAEGSDADAIRAGADDGREPKDKTARRRIRCSGDPIEAAMFGALCPRLLEHCNRAVVKLGEG